MTSDPMKQAWSDVAEGFSTLGRMMKERYQVAGDEGPEDELRAGAESEAGAALRDAFDRLVAAGREFGDRAADVARDDDVRVQARRAAASLNDALSATVDLIGEEVGGLRRRSKGGDSSREIPVSEPPADDDRQ
jgi:hypothetical protein